ncbi:cation:proton antiporter [Thermococcus barossii]|uniref:Sodium:proton antiporter n=1 Tax=Thermococcus barossii TaxID=54077 RepID=A0A2Z2MHY9_9EURY|nr:sodium:proton antiporter [Thermococcus barossii]ASJ04345.1 sodium:proton antiporter [Thermococcus barossii]
MPMSVTGASNVLVPTVDLMVYVFFVVLAVGLVSLIMSKKFNVSYIPLFMFLGILVGPVLGLLNRGLANELFNYVRVFGLVMILFTEGHTLSWKMLKRNLKTILTLDTVGLLLTAFIIGGIFSWLFRVPFIVGFLFGAIIAATDPATLIPLFRQYRVREDIETVIVTESIFNDPMGIVLASVAVAMLVPEASSARFLEAIASYIGLYPAAIIFFLYQMTASILIGILLGIVGYGILKRAEVDDFPEIVIFSLVMAFGGFLLGELVQASGYLVATVTGIVLGNHKVFFKDEIPVVKRVMRAVEREVHFNESLSAIFTIFIFTLLGASLNPEIIKGHILQGVIIAFFLMLVARPLASLPILRWRPFKEYLFISLEGPRGVVPAALASLPLTLGITYNNPDLVQWGEIILSVTIITVLVTVLVETLWVPILRRKLLEVRSIEREMKRAGYSPRS